MSFLTIICISVTIIMVVMAILLLSMDSLEPLEYGIKYNMFNKGVGKETYTGGRYIIGPLTKFIVYPAWNVLIEFSDRRGATVSL